MHTVYNEGLISFSLNHTKMIVLGYFTINEGKIYNNFIKLT